MCDVYAYMYYIHTFINVYIHTFIYINTYTHIRSSYTHTSTPSWIIHECINVYVSCNVQKYTHTHTHSHKLAMLQQDQKGCNILQRVAVRCSITQTCNAVIGSKSGDPTPARIKADVRASCVPSTTNLCVCVCNFVCVVVCVYAWESVCILIYCVQRWRQHQLRAQHNKCVCVYDSVCVCVRERVCI